MKSNIVRRRIDLDNPPPLSPELRAELERAAAMDDADIDFSDIPEVTDFSGFKRLHDHPTHPLSRLYRARKESTTIRVDADVLEWLKSKGKGYQTRLNAILREAMLKDAA